jgi:uncharacterized protein YkwD
MGDGRRDSDLRLRTTILGLSALALLLPSAAAARPCPGADTPPAVASPGRLERAMTCVIERERVRHGRSEVHTSERLAMAARVHARDMVAHDYFDHLAPDGTHVDDRIRRTGYLTGVRAWRVGEVLAWGAGPTGSARGTVRAWLRSSPHRAVLLDPAFRDVGLAVVPGAPRPGGIAGAATAVAVFGRRGATG